MYGTFYPEPQLKVYLRSCDISRGITHFFLQHPPWRQLQGIARFDWRAMNLVRYNWSSAMNFGMTRMTTERTNRLWKLSLQNLWLENDSFPFEMVPFQGTCNAWCTQHRRFSMAGLYRSVKALWKKRAARAAERWGMRERLNDMIRDDMCTMNEVQWSVFQIKR